jgi:indolepyruvate ferredoxin oxidoreductase, alpha subunit
LGYLRSAGEVIFAEEIEPFIEDNVMALAALHWNEVGETKFYGKRSGHVAGPAGAGIGELDPDVVAAALAGITGLEYKKPVQMSVQDIEEMLGAKMPERDLALCAGCPHRASLWALRTALELDGRGGIVIGDIGCYTLGIVRTGYYLLQTVHSMGSGVGIAAGMGKLDRFGFNKPVVTVLGDSTFYHAALPGLINARYHNASFMCVLLDNETTAMTGHQPHPGRMLTATGEQGYTVHIEDMIKGMGIPYEIADPYDVDSTISVIYEMLQQKGPRVLILRRACSLAAVKGKEKDRVFVDTEKCIGDDCGCSRFCSKVFGCPANIWDAAGGKARIDDAVCSGCGVCAGLCPRQAITVERTVHNE